MSGNDAIERLNTEQQQAIIALLGEPTIRKAAEVVGVNEKTIHRWMDDPTFDAALRHARLQQFKQAMAIAQKYAPLRRAVALARADFPSLRGLTVKAEGSLDGLEKLQGGVGDQAVLAITGHLLGLLVEFVGEPLTLRMVRDAWPNASLGLGRP